MQPSHSPLTWSGWRPRPSCKGNRGATGLQQSITLEREDKWIGAEINSNWKKPQLNHSRSWNQTFPPCTHFSVPAPIYKGHTSVPRTRMSPQHSLVLSFTVQRPHTLSHFNKDLFPLLFLTLAPSFHSAKVHAPTERRMSLKNGERSTQHTEPQWPLK